MGYSGDCAEVPFRIQLTEDGPVEFWRKINHTGEAFAESKSGSPLTPQSCYPNALMAKTKDELGTTTPLPLEIHRAILGEVDSKRDLCAVARVSRLMQSEAECLMYREVEMGQKDSTRTIISILRRLAHSVVVPLYVRRFALVISWQRQAECRFLSFFHLLFQVLERMTRLQSLTLRIDTTHIQASIFCRCTFKLSVLDIDYLDKALVTFLESQPEIRILRVAEGLDEEVLLNSPYFLPNLAVLAAGRRNATLLIPGRPVTHVWLSPFELQSLDRLALSSRPVLALGTIFYWKPEAGQPLNSIVHIARVAPDLEALHILLVTRISDTIVCPLQSSLMVCEH
jgi:hypothetical protein